MIMKKANLFIIMLLVLQHHVGYVNLMNFFLKQKKQKLWSEEHFHPQFWENELNLHFYER